MKYIKILFLIIIPLFLSSCYDYKELNELAIINGISIEKEHNEYLVTYEILNTSTSKDSDEESKSYTIKDTGNTLTEALNNINNHLDKTPYFYHIKIMLISSNIDILDIYDYILRSNNFTTNFYLTVADNPNEILTFSNKEHDSNSNIIYNILKNMNYTNITHYFDTTINNIVYKKEDITIPYIKLDNDISFSTYAIYQNGKYLSLLDNKYLDTYKYFIDEDNTSISNDTSSLTFYKKSVNYKLRNDINITVKFKAKIESLNNNINLRNKDNLDTLETEYSSYIKDKIISFLTYLKEERIDILNINHLNYLRTGKYNENYFYDKNISLSINLKIEKPGLIVTGGIK